MAFDFSSLFGVFFVIMMLQPLLTGRWYAMRRAQAIRAIERSHASRVITMIHRQESAAFSALSSRGTSIWRTPKRSLQRSKIRRTICRSIS